MAFLDVKKMTLLSFVSVWMEKKRLGSWILQKLELGYSKLKGLMISTKILSVGVGAGFVLQRN